MTTEPAALIGRWLWSPATYTVLVIRRVVVNECGHTFAVVHEGLCYRNDYGLHWDGVSPAVALSPHPHADPLDGDLGWTVYRILDDVEGRADLPDGVSWIFDGQAPSRAG